MLLQNDTNEYQRLIRDEADAAAGRMGLDLAFDFAQNDFMQQIRQLYACVRSRPEERPQFLFVFPVRDGSFERAMRDTAAAGIGCMTLNRRPRYLAEIRRELPAIPVGSISPDQIEIGRLQARQAGALVRAGGLVLYVMGPSLSSAAQDRAQGFREMLRGTSIRCSEIHGDWDADLTEKAVRRWLQLVLISDQRLDAVICQNDAMATGARRALQAAANEMNRPELRALPLTGVDGLPEVGQRLVDEGQLAATIVQPSTGRPAIEWAVRWLGGHTASLDVVLPVTTYPTFAEKVTLPDKLSLSA
jgi:ABC-type sugar transport system substrate-binding protein